MGLMDTKKNFTDLLSGLVPADKAEKVVAATEALVDQVREQVNEELADQYSETKDQIDRLIEQRDEAIARAQEAELKLQKIAEDSSEIVEQAKASTREEAGEIIAKLEAKIERMEEEKDELQSRIAERYEELRVSDREKLIDKLDEYMETEIGKMKQQLAENHSGDPKLAEAMHQIADIVTRYQASNSGEEIASEITEQHQQEVARLNAQVRMLESRNTRLSTENEMLREKTEVAPADVVTESQEPRAHVTSKKDTASRASELLREAFASEGSSSGSADEQNDGWLTEDPAETRKDRLAKAESVVGKGIVIDESDILKETTQPKPEQTDRRLDERVTPGTDNLTLQEGRILSGIV